MTHAVSRLDLFVTEACNLACGYCFASGRARKNPPLSRLISALDWLARSESRSIHVTLWGGEPLLRPTVLEKVVSHARQSGKRLTLSLPTNATLLDSRSLAWIRDSGTRIFLSIDGDEEAQADRPLASGGSSHAMAIEGMESALRAGLGHRCAVRMTVTPRNAARLARSVSFLAAHGASRVMIHPAYDMPWSGGSMRDHARGQADLARLLVGWLSRADDPRKVPRLDAWMGILEKMLDGARVRPVTGEVRGCGAGKRLVALAVDGTFWPCHRFVHYARARGEDMTLGSLEGGLDAERSSSYAGRRIEDLAGVVRCVACEIRDLCTYGCIATNYATTGRIDRIPPAACRLVRAQIEACRIVHEALEGDPRYALYLGRTLSSPLARVSRELGRRAWQMHRAAT